MKRIAALSLVLILVLSLLSISISADNSLQPQYSTSANSGIRDQICTTLNGTHADDYYTGNYTYENLSELDRSTLLSTLRTLMSKTHKKTTSYNDCRDLAPKTDCQNGDGVTVTLIYTGFKATMDHYINNLDSDAGWNREHVWPKSLGGFGNSGPGADLHHVRPSDQPINSTRGNLKYGNVTTGSAATGAGYTGNALGGYSSGGYFEPLDNVKGDVARICLYLYVRYGGDSSYTCNSITNVFQSVDVLLEWCALDPVDTWEMGRNEVVGKIQGNRNVFIDYPELAWLLFDQQIPADLQTPSSGDTTTPPPPPVTEPPVTEPPVTEPSTPTEPECTHTSTVVQNEVPVTCISDGYTGDTYCADCGDLISYGEVITATGEHQFGDWVVELQPTETEDGHQVRTCPICNHTEVMTLPATGTQQTEPSETSPTDATEPDSTDAPEKPQDSSSPIIWISIAVIAVAGVAVLIFVPKKRNS